jgi:hypothetical protein
MDPLSQIWLNAARRIGLRVVRTADAYAATDGAGTLAIGRGDTLDPDDCLAQMIFHELCHSLIEGESSFERPDWGMDNTGPSDEWREHACLRLQWVMASRYGMRGLLAPTTSFRESFWNHLHGDVLADRSDRTVVAAIAGLRRAEGPPWNPALANALAATAQIAATTCSLAADPTTLWHDVAIPTPHPSGLPAGTSGSCGTCAWRYSYRSVERCRHSQGKVEHAWPGCERFEPALDCQTCGACCRAAYHSVEVGKRDPVVKKHPTYVIDRTTYLELARAGDRCIALEGGQLDLPPHSRIGSAAHPGDPGKSLTRGEAGVFDPTSGRAARYACSIYDDRPKTCRDFTLGSEHCLTARRRVGLSL